MTQARIFERWAPAREDLGIVLTGPVTIQITDNYAVEAAMLVEGFGAPNGTIVVHDHEAMDHQEDILAAAYSWSIIAVSGDTDVYDRDTIIDVLMDWTWAGPPDAAPAWYHKRLKAGRACW